MSKKLSTTVTTAIASMREVKAFLAAQLNLVTVTTTANDAESARQDAFTLSAIAAHNARTAKPKNVRALHIAQANAEATAGIADTAPKGTLYVSERAVEYHALTGSLLLLPDATTLDGADETLDAVVPTKAQGIVSKCMSKSGTAGVRAAIRGAKTRQDALDKLAASMERADKRRADSTDKESQLDGDAGTDGDDGETLGSAPVTEVQTLGTLINRALAMVESGVKVSKSDRTAVEALLVAMRAEPRATVAAPVAIAS